MFSFSFFKFLDRERGDLQWENKDFSDLWKVVKTLKQCRELERNGIWMFEVTETF